MERIESVKIIYNDKDRIFYNFFAELFRLIGLYVEEVLLEDGQDIFGEKDGDSQNLILSMISSTETEDENVFYVDPGKFGRWDMSRSDEEMLGPAREMVEHLRKWLEIRELQFPCEMVKQVLPIYIKNNVLKGAMQLQYYRMKTDIHQESERIFVDTYEDLKSLGEESEYLTYAKIYCRQKANLSCYFQVEKPLHYAINALVKECGNLIEQHPYFTNAWVLMGMLCERSSDGLKMAIDSYKNALTRIGHKSFASHIYYWVGLLYEKFSDRHGDAVYAYRRAYQLRRKYRNIYKLGFMAEKEENYQEAVSYYKECVGVLEQRIRGNMDPLEVEYYFKTGVLICFHSQRNLEDYTQAIKYGLKMLDFYRQEFSENPNSHFQYFYGTEAEKYQKISENRLKCKRLYQCLAIAYRETGDERTSMEYWALSEKIER